MQPQKQTLTAGETLFTAGEIPDHAFLIEKGKLRLTRRLGELDVPVSLLGPGDVVFAEGLTDVSQQISYSAIAQGEVSGFQIHQQNLNEFFQAVPEWVRIILLRNLYRQRMQERPERSNVDTLYGLLNSFYAFIRMVDRSGGDTQLRGPLKPISDELRKSRSSFRHFVPRILDALSQTALIDVRHGDPLAPLLLIPDVQLFLGFLGLLQNAADLKDGLHENMFVLKPLRLSREAEILIDGLMMDEELADRLFEPERSMVHLPLERLSDIYKKNGGNGDLLDEYHPCLKELEQHAAFTRVVDNQRVSVFLNLRNLLRLTVRRDPTSNFVDIIDFLLEEMYLSRFEFEPAQSFNIQV